MAKPVLTTISQLTPLTVVTSDVMLEVEDSTEGSRSTTIGDISDYVLNEVLDVHYTKEESDGQYKPIDAIEAWGDIAEKPEYMGVGATAEAARNAIGAGTSSLVIGTEAGTAAEGNDERIVNAVQQSQIGVTVAGLDENQLIPPENLPSFVDDVLEYDTKTDLPVQGERGKIYLVLDTHIQYRWSGTKYTQITIGEVTSVNGRKGIVTGLAEESSVADRLGDRYTKSEADGRFLTKETYSEQDPFYSTEVSDGRFRQRIKTANKVYVTDDQGNESELVYTDDTTKETLVQRDVDGEIKVPDATKATSAVTLGQLAALSNATAQGFSDRYVKSETYTKDEVNGLFDNLGNTLRGYSLPVVTTSGEMDLDEANVFLLNDVQGRAVSFINEPVGRSILIIIKILGDTPVLWPDDVDWVLASTPILGSDYTIVNIFKHGSTYVGQHSISVNKAID